MCQSHASLIFQKKYPHLRHFFLPVSPLVKIGLFYLCADGTAGIAGELLVSPVSPINMILTFALISVGFFGLQASRNQLCAKNFDYRGYCARIFHD